MRRHVWTRVLLLGALFALACTDRNPFAPEPPELNVIPAPFAQCSPAFAKLILSEITQIYRGRPLLGLEAGIRFAVIVLQCQRKPAEAQTRAVKLSAFVAQLFQDHRLLSSIPWDGVSRHIDHLYQYVGLPAPGIPAATVGAGASFAVVGPTDDPTVIVAEDAQGTPEAGVNVPTGAFSETQTVLVTITPDPLGTNPFPNPAGFPEFRPFYHFQTFPPLAVFHQQVLVGICVELPEEAAQAHRLQLAHPNHADPSQLELLARVDAGFLPCNSYVRAGSDAVNLAQAGRAPLMSRVVRQTLALFRPQLLQAATTLSPGGLGGLTGNFSDFRAVDPGATAPAGSIDFETYPNGSPTCGDCKVGNEFAVQGVTFSFLTAFEVDTLPHICNSTPNDPPGGPVNHAVTAPAVGDPCNGWAGGNMTMTFGPYADTVTFRLRGPDAGNFNVTAYDGSGAVLPGTQVIHSTVGTYTPAGPGATGTRREERITVINPIGKISRVKVDENGSIKFLDNLRIVVGGSLIGS